MRDLCGMTTPQTPANGLAAGRPGIVAGLPPTTSQVGPPQALLATSVQALVTEPPSRVVPDAAHAGSVRDDWTLRLGVVLTALLCLVLLAPLLETA